MKSKNLLIALLAVILYMPGFAQAAEPPEPKLTPPQRFTSLQ